MRLSDYRAVGLSIGSRIQRFIQSNACIVVKSMKSRCLVCNHLINKLKKKILIFVMSNIEYVIRFKTLENFRPTENKSVDHWSINSMLNF